MMRKGETKRVIIANAAQPTLPCPSPCVKHCGIDSSKLCSGCYRTGPEIAAWYAASDNEKWAILARANARRSDENR